MSKNAWCVYKHTAPNGKIYIGITSRKPEYRWNNGKGYSKNILFNRAIQKYGWENIEHEILFTDLTKEEAEAKEIELIDAYHANNRQCGYNIACGGLVNTPSEETKNKLSQIQKGKRLGIPSWAKGKHFSEDHRRKISIANKNRPKSVEHVQKMRESKKGKCLGGSNPDAKKIIKCTLNGEAIKLYECINDALKELNKSPHDGHISSCARGKRKSAYGFKWKYFEEGDAV